jgi:hypothetical protein
MKGRKIVAVTQKAADHVLKLKRSGMFSHHGFKVTKVCEEKISGNLKSIIAEARNPELDSKYEYWDDSLRNADDRISLTGIDRHIVFYPSDVLHAKTFALGVRFVEPLGPSTFFPGSVGSLHYCFENPDTPSIKQHGEKALKQKTYRVKSIQGSFKAEKPEKISKLLAAKYFGWQNVLFNHLFKKAIQERVERIKLSTKFVNQKTNEVTCISQVVLRKFANAAAVHEFKVEREGIDEIVFRRLKKA